VLGFEVRDTGIGIPEDKRHAVFQKFVQADNRTTRMYVLTTLKRGSGV
jgi:signal transduction histidine kinase